MAKGRLMALGSNMFLKNKFGVGYNITFVKLKNSVESASILNIIKNYIPEATILTNVSSEISIQLPL
jgi:ATP-binding cassette subfamily A (ABC1) protein 3